MDSFDCSGIDVTDGNTADWENIPDIINSDESVTGTVYYLNSNTDVWTNTEPTDWRYSANLEQQANIQQMKICNTDTFFMMLRTEEPMMFFYDKDQDTFVDFWSQNFTLPADYHYWMVWKMQAATGEGAITYMAADLTMEAGRALGGEQEDDNDRVPKLYLYEETDLGTFADASFNPNEDTQLVEIELSEDEPNCDSNNETDDAECGPETASKENYAFEVSQDISELFNYADFNYGDTINISAAMYNSESFTVASDQTVLTVIDQTDTQEYTFSKRAVTGVHPAKNSATDQSIQLKWKKLKSADSYQLKLINPTTDTVIRVVRGVSGNHYTVRNLTASTSYRVIVRGVIRQNRNKTYSAWSSGYQWTTEE